MSDSDNTQTANAENSDAEKGKKNDIFVFPATLRSQVEDGATHVRFKALDGKETGAVVHLFVPQGVSIPDAAAGWGGEISRHRAAATPFSQFSILN